MDFNEISPNDLDKLARPKVLSVVADALRERFGDQVHVDTNNQKVYVRRSREVYIVSVERRSAR